jgi:nicotinate-nucleotide adenylyltransferase
MEGFFMRIGVFGGTFDPIHLGHLLLAEQCREQAQLETVWFIPSAVPPHKQNRSITPFDRRVEMLQLALAGNPVFQINTLERDRQGPSYTADTLELLQNQHPHAQLFLMIGADCLPDLPKWYEPQRILQLATLLVTDRGNHPIGTPEQLAEAIGLQNNDLICMQHIPIPLIDFASTEIRDRVQTNRSIRYFVPAAVEVYIREKKLYRLS